MIIKLNELSIAITDLERRILQLKRRYLQKAGWFKVGRKWAKEKPHATMWTIEEAYYLEQQRQKSHD